MESLGIVVLPLIFGLIGAFIAHAKNRSKLLWFILSAIFLIIPVIILVFLPKLSGGEGAEDGAAQEKPKSMPIGKIITVMIIVIVAGLYAYNLELQKKEAAAQAKAGLTEACNADQDCLNKIETNFDRCIKTNLTYEKTGRRTRTVKLDNEKLRSVFFAIQMGLEFIRRP